MRNSRWPLVLFAVMPFAGLFIAYVALLTGERTQLVVGLFLVVYGPVMFGVHLRRRQRR